MGWKRHGATEHNRVQIKGTKGSFLIQNHQTCSPIQVGDSYIVIG